MCYSVGQKLGRTNVPMKKAVEKLLHIPIISISDCGKLQQTFSQAAGQTTNTGQVSSVVTIMCRNDELS